MKPIFFFFAVVFSSSTVFAQIEPVYRQPKSFVTNGALDSFGYFRFYSKDYLFDHYSTCVKDHTDDQFYFYKEALVKGGKDKMLLVFPFWNYLLVHPDMFSKSLTTSQIKRRLLEKEKLTKADVSRLKQFVVSDAKFRSVMSLSADDFFKKYIAGIVIANVPEYEQMAVILTLLKMNIPVSTYDVTGDLIVPTKPISKPIW